MSLPAWLEGVGRGLHLALTPEPALTSLTQLSITRSVNWDEVSLTVGVNLIRLVTGVVIVLALPLCAWFFLPGKWRRITFPLSANAALAILVITSEDALDSWESLGVWLWVLGVVGLVAGVFLLPATLLWPDRHDRTPWRWTLFLMSTLFGAIMWIAINHLGLMMSHAWHHWGLCLWPGEYSERMDTCEVGPASWTRNPAN